MLRSVIAALAILKFVVPCSMAYANFVPRTKLCEMMTVDHCAAAVKRAIEDAPTSEQALEAWGAWAEAYEKAYRGFANVPIPPSDLDRIEEAISDKIDSYTNPANIAADLAIKRYFPLIASFLEFCETPIVVFVVGVLSPSPMVTPVQELKSYNDDLGKHLWSKIHTIMAPDWKSRYSELVKRTFNGPTLQRQR